MFRKKKAVHKTTTTDDKRLQSTLKRIGVNAIPSIEEVNIFKDDVVIQFTNPKGTDFSLWCMILFATFFLSNTLMNLFHVLCFSSSRCCCQHLGREWYSSNKEYVPLLSLMLCQMSIAYTWLILLFFNMVVQNCKMFFLAFLTNWVRVNYQIFESFCVCFDCGNGSNKLFVYRTR